MGYISGVVSQEYKGTGNKAEEVVRDVLIDCGYTQRDFQVLSKDLGAKNRTQLFEFLDTEEHNLEVGTFFYQPLGSQKAPDFIVVTEEGIDYVEVKASKKPNSILFNGHLIRPDFTYVISDPAVGFIVRQGYELMDSEVRETLQEIDSQLRNIVAKGNEKLLALDSNPQSWSYYVRAMYCFRRLYEPGPILHKT
jgi:hypothetical protein